MPVTATGKACVLYSYQSPSFRKSADGYVKLVVPPESAKLPQYSSSTIHSNHMDMTKFRDKDDVGFQLISGDLLRWLSAPELSKGSTSELSI